MDLLILEVYKSKNASNIFQKKKEGLFEKKLFCLMSKKLISYRNGWICLI